MQAGKTTLFSIIFTCILLAVDCRRDRRKLLRKKRYVAFPEGAAFSAVYCVTSQMGITDGASIFSEGINWGLVYDLPNDTRPLFEYYGAAQKRRNRRDLYGKVEGILTSMGYNGRGCILRSLCEASRYFKPREDSLAHHILGLIFRFPLDPIMPHEPDDHRTYHWAARMGGDGLNDERGSTKKCSDVFRCPFSLIDLALGYYSGGVSGELKDAIDGDYAY